MRFARLTCGSFRSWKSDAVLLYVRDSSHASIAVSVALSGGGGGGGAEPPEPTPLSTPASPLPPRVPRSDLRPRLQHQNPFAPRACTSCHRPGLTRPNNLFRLCFLFFCKLRLRLFLNLNLDLGLRASLPPLRTRSLRLTVRSFRAGGFIAQDVRPATECDQRVLCKA